jgi:hypothetical protein
MLKEDAEQGRVQTEELRAALPPPEAPAEAKPSLLGRVMQRVAEIFDAPSEEAADAGAAAPEPQPVAASAGERRADAPADVGARRTLSGTIRRLEVDGAMLEVDVDGGSLDLDYEGATVRVRFADGSEIEAVIATDASTRPGPCASGTRIRIWIAFAASTSQPTEIRVELPRSAATIVARA